MKLARIRRLAATAFTVFTAFGIVAASAAAGCDLGRPVCGRRDDGRHLT